MRYGFKLGLGGFVIDGLGAAMTPGSLETTPSSVPVLDAAGADRIVGDAVGRYFQGRRDKVAPFIDAHFTLSGALKLHRAAVGLDLVRAPANVALMLPAAGVKLGGLAPSFSNQPIVSSSYDV